MSEANDTVITRLAENFVKLVHYKWKRLRQKAFVFFETKHKVWLQNELDLSELRTELSTPQSSKY